MERHLRGYSRGISVKKKARKINILRIFEGFATTGRPLIFRKWLCNILCTISEQRGKLCKRNCVTKKEVSVIQIRWLLIECAFATFLWLSEEYLE